MPKNAGSLATIETNGIGSERVKERIMENGGMLKGNNPVWI